MSISNIEDKITEDIKDNQPGNILARLFRKILLELGYTPVRFSNRLDQFTIENNKLAKLNPYIKKMSRPYVVRKLTNNDLTWKVFVEGLFHFLRIKKMKITIELTHINNKVTSHELAVINNDTTGKSEVLDV